MDVKNIKFFNTLTRKKEIFKPLKKGEVKMYTCGPTVYNYPHIGNYRAYLFADLIKKYLIFQGFKVKHVLNITDVDDKTIRDSQKENRQLKEFTSFYTKEFFNDLEKLNIKKADIYPRATQHIKEMVVIINYLLKKGFAYKGENGDVYFAIKKFSNYGKLSGINVKKLKIDASQRIKNDEYDKTNPQDFALWKAWNEKDGQVFWKTPFGKGRPGWHIECSAMSLKHLGKTFDIHTGGVDLIFPHHENEIAQSESYTNKPFVKYWLHNDWLLVDGKKMSKSLGNFFTLKDIENRKLSSLAYRYFLLNSHYRTTTNFTWEAMEASQIALDKIINFYQGLKTKKGVANKKYLDLFKEALGDDLNTSKALAWLWAVIKDQKLPEAEKKATLFEFDKVFSLGLKDQKITKIPKELNLLMEQRAEARQNKNWQLSDEIRDKIKALGYEIKDTPEGAQLNKI